MDNKHYNILMAFAILLTVAWLGWSVYEAVIVETVPGDSRYLAGNSYFEDGRYNEALTEYQAALAINPDHIHAERGKARSLMQLGRSSEALAVFDDLVKKYPDFAASYANRGILYDRMGRFQAAMQDYEKALQLDPNLADGPHWLTRFLRNQPQRPPTIADRARYLKEQLDKPESERVLRLPEEDKRQRPYKL
jgi:tetratricopeptide (TPR) repeat protein